MGERAREAIRAAIMDHGPISFAELMEHALYGPGGFYEHPPVGEAGHFVTSPHVHPVFAHLVARGLLEMWGALGRPRPFRVVELGAGDGTLARFMLPELAEGTNGGQVDYTAVERSRGARELLGQLRVHVLPAIEAVPTGITGCVIANELLDNLPFHWLRGTADGTVEVHVDTDGGGFITVERPWDSTDAPFEDGPPPLAPGEERAFSPRALRLIERTPRVLASGYALFIDYAGPVASGALVHGYRGHRVIEDVLADPGSSDITAGVHLASIAARAEALGLQAFPSVSQRAALIALGYRDWTEAERRRQARLQDERSGREAAQTWSGRNAAALLVDPEHLGRLRWLMLATPGLPAPGWLSEAARMDAQELLEGSAGATASMRYEDLARPSRWRISGRRRRPRRRRSP
jgi:SAM-dependent MidA family methyltransferase